MLLMCTCDDLVRCQFLLRERLAQLPTVTGHFSFYRVFLAHVERLKSRPTGIAGEDAPLHHLRT